MRQGVDVIDKQSALDHLRTAVREVDDARDYYARHDRPDQARELLAVMRVLRDHILRETRDDE